MTDICEPIAVALERVQPAVDDAMARIVQYVIPYFTEVAANHGIIWTPAGPNKRMNE